MAQGHVRRREFIKLVEDLVAVQISVQSRTVIEKDTATKPPCSPISQISSTVLLVTYKATKIMAFRENY
jgi:hypothetical protein